MSGVLIADTGSIGSDQVAVYIIGLRQKLGVSNIYDFLADYKNEVLKIISESISDMTGTGVALDAGIQYVNMPVEIDEKTLTEIAGTTNGNYFRATSNDRLKQVYQEIDKLEKTKLNVKEFSKREEEFEIFAWIAFLCILLDVLLRNTLLKKIP